MFPSAIMQRFLWLTVPLLFVSACGRPATETECEEIVTRVASLEYQASNPNKGLATSEQLETIRARVHDAMMRSCVGKRITSKAMTCVRNAKTATEIREKCFD